LALEAAIKEHPAYNNRKPHIMFLIAQKRNIARLGVDLDGKIGSPPAGTVLDNTITSRESLDFYLIAHKAVVGSAKPIHYYVYRNDMNGTLTQIEDMLFKLCHLHPGCTLSVSLPAPLYNAHKLGYRMGQVYRAAMESKEDTRSEGSADSAYNYEAIILPPSLKYAPFFL